jgi:hypothetical protein
MPRPLAIAISCGRQWLIPAIVGWHVTLWLVLFLTWNRFRHHDIRRSGRIEENPYEAPRVRLSHRKTRHPIRNLVILAAVCLVLMLGPIIAFQR